MPAHELCRVLSTRTAVGAELRAEDRKKEILQLRRGSCAR